VKEHYHPDNLQETIRLLTCMWIGSARCHVWH
jgi:hypothetical protein